MKLLTVIHHNHISGTDLRFETRENSDGLLEIKATDYMGAMDNPSGVTYLGYSNKLLPEYNVSRWLDREFPEITKWLQYRNCPSFFIDGIEYKYEEK